MTGRDKGKKGRIISINRVKYTAIVEGANLVSKHTKPNQDNPKGWGLSRKKHQLIFLTYYWLTQRVNLLR